MKTTILLALAHILSICQLKTSLPTLYEVPDSHKFAEFSNEESRQAVESDMKKFDQLDSYTPKCLHELNPKDPKFAEEVSRQIYEQSDQQGSRSFFQPPSDLQQQIQDKYNKGTYDQETNSYLKNFKNEKVMFAMKKLHEQDYNQQIQKWTNSQSFMQISNNSFMARPKSLSRDFKSSFTGLENKSKFIPLTHLQQLQDQYNCWASSRYEYAYIYITYHTYTYWKNLKEYSNTEPRNNFYRSWNCYPCLTSFVNGHFWMFWFSEKLPQKSLEKEITYILEFEYISRIRQLDIIFMTAPREYWLEGTQDKENWYTIAEKKESPHHWQYDWWVPQAYWDPIIYTKAIRIVMKGFRPNQYNDRHGIYQVNAWNQQQTIMILEQKPTDIPNCLVRAEALWHYDNMPFIMMNCYDAMFMMDAREIFILDLLQIKTFMDSYCIHPQPADPSQTEQYIVTSSCEDEDDHKWIISNLGSIKNIKYNTCLSASNSKAIEMIQDYGFVSVSSTLSDSRANPWGPIDRNGHAFWAPILDSSSGWYQVDFDRQYLAEKLVIKWKVKPPRVEIKLHGVIEGWYSVYSQEPKGDVDLVFTPAEILGFKIIMFDLDQKEHPTNDHTIYGISKIELRRPGTATSLQSCQSQDEGSRIMNRWKIEPVDYIDISYKLPYNQAQKFMFDEYKQSNVRVFLSQIQKFSSLMRRALKIRDILKGLNSKLDFVQKDQLACKSSIIQYGDPNLANTDEQGPKFADQYYGRRIQYPASDCETIKQIHDYKRNGFYWVQTQCMPKAERVYCDFKNYYPNFYVYTGYLKDKNKAIEGANTVSGVQSLCNKIGLSPVQIISESQFEHILQYLDQAGASAQYDKSIPIAYKFDSKNPFTSYRSFNSPDSKSVDNLLQNYISFAWDKGINSQSPSDTLLLKNSKNKLSEAIFSNEQIRGVICSENKEPYSDHGEYRDFDCETVFFLCQDLMKELVLTKINIRCKSDCLQSKGSVVKGEGDVFSAFSKVCKAAMYYGLGRSDQPFTFKVKIIKTQHFSALNGESHNVKLDQTSETVIKGFKFVQETKEELCPNLQKKSFISFNEILNKVANQKQNRLQQSSSFIESSENSDLHDLVKDYKSKEETSDNAPMVPEHASILINQNSRKAIEYIRKKLQEKIQIARNYMKYLEDQRSIIEKENKNMLSIYLSDLSHLKQNEAVNRIETSFDILVEKQNEFMLLATDQVKKAEHALNSQIDYYLILRRFKPHKENYKQAPILSISYTSMDFYSVANPSDWKYTTENISPHKQAISQPSPTSCKDNLLKPNSECIATQLEIKHKILFDFQVRFSFKTQQLESGYIGVLFRKKDLYNYYVLDLNKRFVRIRRMINGEQKMVAYSKLDNELFSAVWYNLELTMQKSTIQVKLAQEHQEANFSTLQEILKTNDALLKSGSIALHTDNVLESFFDDFSVTPLECYSDKYDSDKVPKFLIKTNRFREDFQQDISGIWEQNIEGQNLWHYKYAYFRKTGVMYNQIRSTLDGNGNSVNSQQHIILKDKWFQTGTISFEILFENEDTETCLKLLYVDRQNFLKFCLSNKKVELVMFLDGKKNTLANLEKYFKEKIWYKFNLIVDDKEIKIHQWNFEKSAPECMFNHKIMITSQLRRGQIIWSSHKGSVAIFDFSIDPIISKEICIDQPGWKAEVNQRQQEEKELLNTEGNDDIDELIEDKGMDVSMVEPELSIRPNSQMNQENGYQECLSLNTYEAREDFCMNSFGSSDGLAMCVPKFCSICCASKFVNERIGVKQCEIKCEQVEVRPLTGSSFDTCVEVSGAEFSVYNFCEEAYKDELSWAQAYCMRDLCQACCVTVPVRDLRNVPTSLIQNCQNQCKNKYVT